MTSASRSSKERWGGRWAAGFAALALILGSLFVYPRQWTRGFLINDEAWYAEPARNLAEGQGFATYTLYPMFASEIESLPMQEPFKQIGYPLVAALLSSVTGFSDQLFVAVALVGFALTGMATWLVSLSLVRSKVAAGAITLATIGNPVFWSWWTAALPESLFTAIFLAGIWLLLQDSVRTRVAAGGLLAASVYFKGFAILYLPLALAFVFWSASHRRVAHTAAFVGGALVTLGVATIALPSGTSQLSGASSRYAGSMLLYETRGAYPQHEGPLYDTNPIEPLRYIIGHPLDYGEKVARMISRTKLIVDALGGPGFGGVLFPLLLLVGGSVASDVVRWMRAAHGKRLGEQDRAVVARRLLLAGLIAVNFAFFWAGNFKVRYFAHLFPLMLAAGCLEFDRLVPHAKGWYRKAPPVLVGVATIYFLVYPSAVGLWTGYRDPHAYLGRMLAVRWADYGEVAATVSAHVPEDGMVMSDMAHEITWYTNRPSVFFPGSERELNYLVDRFDVQAMYEHPRTSRTWPTVHERFELVDDKNGRFWVRRDSR